ncbi:Ribonuclease T2-like [Macleaya cordata]|uniref:Ribonuclease T2-like n=1 Tax=Macleaya cordata TaxID=56857 RepID=A0A200QF01_MACCD|nr:Ribonuclease T2-like [Macleaya cordata]
MKTNSTSEILLFCSIIFALQLLAILCCSTVSDKDDFDFFYFVQQWPGSYCHTKHSSCCYPTTGKPASDFGIHGLWPNYNSGSYPSSCDPDRPFVPSEISEDLKSRMSKNWPTLACPSSDGTKFWSHEWEKHGTCSGSIFDQRKYFETALNLKKQMNLLQILENAGIKPNGRIYSLHSITEAIREATGFSPGIQCNMDGSGHNHQLYQIYMCVDTSGSNFIECPLLPKGSCSSNIEFPSF